jgi:hypothetical protein
MRYTYPTTPKVLVLNCFLSLLNSRHLVIDLTKCPFTCYLAIIQPRENVASQLVKKDMVIGCQNTEFSIKHCVRHV